MFVEFSLKIEELMMKYDDSYENSTKKTSKVENKNRWLETVAPKSFV